MSKNRKVYSDTYKVWAGMRKRCLTKTCDAYKYYGGKGIKICDRWNVYQSFLDDMGEKPQGKTIDRINSNGNYEPTNCRWADRRTQIKNRSNAILLKSAGKEMSIQEWSEHLGISYYTIYLRLRRGLSVDDALYEKKIPRSGWKRLKK